MMHFFYYAEFYVNGNNGKQFACADGGVNLPTSADINKVRQKSHLKNVSRLG